MNIKFCIAVGHLNSVSFTVYDQVQNISMWMAEEKQTQVDM